MAYDDYSPQTVHPQAESITEEVSHDMKDPHVILTCIAEADAQIRTLRQQREKLLALYQERMMGIEQHWHSVMNSEPSEAGYDMPQPEKLDPRRW